MTSKSSGYVRGRNSSSDQWREKNISVPAGATVFVSIKQNVPSELPVSVYRFHMEQSEVTGRFREVQSLVWHRLYDYKSDFVHVFQTTRLYILLKNHLCIKAYCFTLYFSFFLPNRIPQKLPSGLWNCSASYYSSIHQHLACNHQTECEDGRDETEHCSFSSPECQGLVPFCNRCYKFIKDLEIGSYTKKEDVMTLGYKYCNSLGATLSLPKCDCHWYHILLDKTMLHRKRFLQFWTGFYSNDLTLPSMYAHALLNNKTVLYHSFEMFANDQEHWGVKKWYKSLRSELGVTDCFRRGKQMQKIGLSCEFRSNRTKEPPFQTVFLPSRHFALPSGQHSMTVCAGGHVTHTSFLCGSQGHQGCIQDQVSTCDISDQISLYDELYSAHQHISMFPTFRCSDGSLLPYSIICDFISDCQDKSDESVCQHPVCLHSFTCANGQCLSFHNVCDQTPHCYDRTDEQNCDYLTMILITQIYLPFPALITFDTVRQFTSVRLASNESCPDSHYRCPGDFNDCLPVYTRCNGIYDCLDHQDEDGCEDLRCPGFFRCRVSKTCVHNDQLCDSWPHCPLSDDELLCGVTCPVGCLCQGHTFLCFQPFSATLFPQLYYLDATLSGMTLSDVNNHAHLFHLILARCSLTLLPHLILSNLRILDLSDNQFQHFNVTSLSGLKNLYKLSLSKNPLISIHGDTSASLEQSPLSVLDLSHTLLTVYDATYFSSFLKLQKLNLTSTSIHTISPEGFQFMPQLTELYMDGSPIKTFPPDLFEDLRHLRIIVTDNHKLCCDEILPYNFDSSSCLAPRNEISSCKDLLQSWVYRGFLWLIGCLSLTGNVFCFCARFFANSMKSSSGFSVFVLNLTMADFLMGVYIAIIGTADEQFRGTYLHHDHEWKSSVTCKISGVLSLLSSEVSALIIWIITLDRFVVLHFPFSMIRFDRVSAAVACLLIWLVALFLVLVPLLPEMSHWNFYGQTDMCIPLPVTTQKFKGRWYSFSILIAFNFVLFLFISVGQTLIYWSIQSSTLKTNTTKVSQDMTIARRLITVAVTDFMCWFPIGMCGLLALAGVAVPGEVNVALAIFALPLNSAVNPFMYTFNTLAEKRKRSNEAKLLKWLESCSDMIET